MKATSTTTAELRIPADPSYIVVAKRAASGFAYIAGFGMEAMDELGIAITQACENAIRCVGPAGGQLRISFGLEDQRLTIQVASSCARTAVTAEPVEPEAQPARSARADAASRRAAEVSAQEAALRSASEELALRVMGLFVDDCRYRVDERTGGLRVRLTKYRAS
jgi:anti-sigma regulatory factor (Ser/Thr protein kinase)